MKIFSPQRLNLIIAVCAVLISGASFYATYLQANAAEKQVRAMTLPLIRFEHGNYDPERERTELTFSLHNAGVGPAIIESLKFNYKGATYQTLNEFFDACCAQASQGFERDLEVLLESGDSSDAFRQGYTTSPLSNVIVPGQSDYEFLTMRRAPLNQNLWEKLNRERWGLSIETCFCSLLGECFVAGPDKRTYPVSACPENSN